MRTSRVPRWLRTIRTRRACRPTACPAVASKSSPARSSLRSTRRAARSYMPGRSPAHSLGVKQRKRQFLVLESSFYLRVGDCCGPGGQCVYRGERSAGTALVYVTYLGAGSLEPTVGTVATDFVTAIAADGAGHAYLAGSTSDLAFPATAAAFQTALAGQVAPPLVGPSDAFVAKLNPTGSAMVWATFLGGSGNDQAQTIAVDSAGDVWVSGITRSTDFPTKVSATSNGSEFLAELNSTGSALSYSALFPSDTVAAALAVDADGTVHVGGATGPISAFSP